MCLFKANHTGRGVKTVTINRETTGKEKYTPNIKCRRIAVSITSYQLLALSHYTTDGVATTEQQDAAFSICTGVDNFRFFNLYRGGYFSQSPHLNRVEDLQSTEIY